MLLELYLQVQNLALLFSYNFGLKIQRLHSWTYVSDSFLPVGLEDSQASSSQFEEFSVTPCKTDKANELKVRL